MDRPVKLFECAVDPAAIEATSRLLASGQLAAGSNVAALEDALKVYLGASDVVVMGDMTHAIALALRMGGVAPGDEVLTLALNCLSSNVAIAHAGATPVWVDIDPDTATLCLEDAERALTPRTRALIVYHVAGYPADVAAIRAFCDRHGLLMIEDANNALGARSGEGFVGLTGDFGILSFYANRQLNGIEGGALICRSARMGDEARRLRRFGIDASRFRDSKGEIDPAVDVPEIGMSSPMNNVNAGLALSHLGSLNDRLAISRANVARLEAAAADLPGLTPVRPASGASPVYWTWLVRATERERLMDGLRLRGIQCSRLHHRNDTYTGFGAASRELPGTLALQGEMLALPCGWWVTGEDIDRMTAAVSDVLAGASGG